ncbi:binding-protein-dependent transport systems inner membrane component [Caballeronia hypogeia]|uniref:Binding-protein-dependent transport systems inner membrane component n=1 Tax=Caballeronia hypogeia TaxID=1777140 RepID=A0A158CZV3_9BURK|nr:ABC transporter permease [Caballeronia hypogeia]SAK87771.1 binding-protein-dependent transport systems inner membrane component [Caballeronia hypogeia]
MISDVVSNSTDGRSSAKVLPGCNEVSVPAALLKRSLRQAERRGHLRAYALIAPLFLFVLLSFVLPLGTILVRSFHNTTVPEGLANTINAVRAWNGTRQETPPEPVYAALATDMKIAARDQTTGDIAARLNIEQSGLRAAFMKASRRVNARDEGPWKEVFVGADPAWGETPVWGTIRNLASSNNDLFLLSALDMRRDTAGSIVMQPSAERVYVDVFLRTAGISIMVTLMCLALGFPISYLLAHSKDRVANLLLILVLLPFWTSLLVRTTAWIVLLQENGVINSFLKSVGLISSPVPMMFNRFGVVIAMTHILLPFTILPMYSVMRQIPSSYVRAARSLGASPTTCFLRVYLPQCVPGMSAGALLVFILALGYYITPALLGGAGDQMVSYFIADNLTRSLNWGLAAALGALLLVAVLALYYVYDRFVGITNMRLA